jgi:hypothetical protein
MELQTTCRFQIPAVDAVVSTLVLCCVADQRRSIQENASVEAWRKARLFRARGRNRALRRFQNWVTPIWKRMGDGCHPNRETWIELEQAGFGKLNYDNFRAPPSR